MLGNHTFYVVLSKQNDGRFDNEVADAGIHNLRLREDGVFGSNDDVTSYAKFDLAKFRDTYNLQPLYISQFEYNSKLTYIVISSKLVH